MPRTVRNFWIEVEIDGQVTKLAGGPKAADGGMRVRFMQRDEGTVLKLFDVWARPTGAGELCTSIDPNHEACRARTDGGGSPEWETRR